jgi:CheY-like chemotaxis protein
MSYSQSEQKVRILIIDDDADDRYLMQTAFAENNIQCEIQFVEDGSEVFDFLYRQGKYKDVGGELPNLILLDLNMPKKDGRQVLLEIKRSPQFQHIPVIIFTTSKSPDDVRQIYINGANSFVNKPSSFDKLLEVTRNIGHYWGETVTLA